MNALDARIEELRARGTAGARVQLFELEQRRNELAADLDEAADVTDDRWEELKSDLFRALAHPTRIRILERLVPGPQSVQDLQYALALDQPIVSQHLAAMRAKNVVTVRREGTQAVYAFDHRQVASAELIQALLARFKLADLEVRRPPLEETIRRIYEEKLLVE